jgi:hypothetical protein
MYWKEDLCLPHHGVWERVGKFYCIIERLQWLRIEWREREKSTGSLAVEIVDFLSLAKGQHKF